MKLSTKGRYGLRAMLELALNYNKRPLLLREIAKNQDISEKYLERILSTLKANGFIKSTRGAQGGYTLSRPPSEIKLSDVVQSLEGSLAPVECVDDPKICNRSNFCATIEVWLKIKKSMMSTLRSMTLKDLIQIQNEKSKKGVMYNI
jgi:Rrf2 family transcriptional regulator, cysteine metabolism repressor